MDVPPETLVCACGFVRVIVSLCSSALVEMTALLLLVAWEQLGQVSPPVIVSLLFFLCAQELLITHKYYMILSY